MTQGFEIVREVFTWGGYTLDSDTVEIFKTYAQAVAYLSQLIEDGYGDYILTDNPRVTKWCRGNDTQKATRVVYRINPL